VSTPRAHIKRIKALTGCDEKAVPFGTAETEVPRGLGSFDEAKPSTFGIENVHTVEAVANPTGARPNVAIPCRPLFPEYPSVESAEANRVETKERRERLGGSW
jgi:hypothetical protein